MQKLGLTWSDGADRDGMGRRHFGGVTHKYHLDNSDAFPGAGWVKYLVRELSRVPGGLEGLTNCGNHWTNREC